LVDFLLFDNAKINYYFASRFSTIIQVEKPIKTARNAFFSEK
jgi:hypothetical protein